MTARGDRWSRGVLLTGAGLILVALTSCSGPDDFSDPPATVQVSTPQSTASPEPTGDASPTVDPTPEETETSEPTATDEPDASPTATTEPTPEATATDEPDPTSTPEPINAMDALPGLEELPEGSYVVASQGDRTAEQLANAYVDSTAHLMRLDDWGFQQHVFREFTHNETGPDDSLPTYVLATVNVYGSPEQADMAVQWLEDFQVNQGATLVDAPDIGDTAVALTVNTREGVPTASVYVRLDDRVYIYYAQDNEPLPVVTAVAEQVFQRLTGGDIAGAVGQDVWNSVYL